MDCAIYMSSHVSVFPGLYPLLFSYYFLTQADRTQRENPASWQLVLFVPLLLAHHCLHMVQERTLIDVEASETLAKGNRQECLSDLVYA